MQTPLLFASHYGSALDVSRKFAWDEQMNAGVKAQSSSAGACTAPSGERAYESCAAHRKLLGQPPAADAVAAASAPPLLQPLAHLSPAPDEFSR